MREYGTTLPWELYQSGREYNSRLVPNQYTLVDTNTEFFAGNQWVNLPDSPAMRALPKPTFNILKRVASLFIASLTSSAVTVRFEPLRSYSGDEAAADFATAEVGNLLEKFKFDYRVREALFDGAVSGDYCAHFYFDPAGEGELRMELIDGINVHFGDSADCRVENQPYILLVGRESVAALEEEARRYGNGGVLGDSETEDFPGVGGRTEVRHEEAEKALYVLLYEKKNGTVRVTKATRSTVIYEDIDTGLTRYPIAWGNWERQKNQYHGRALVTGLIPNQIFINTMFATAMRHLQLMAFPKTVYNADLVPRWNNEVGSTIAVHGLQPGQNIAEVAYHLSGAEMSGQIFALIDKTMAYTKECLGATDAQMGSVRPENTSALMVLQTNAEVPLENIRALLYEWVEDIAAILLDMMATYYGVRTVLVEETVEEVVMEGSLPAIDEATGRMKTEKRKRRLGRQVDFSILRSLGLRTRVDVGATTYFSEIAMTQTLDNLRREGLLDVVEYLERLPDKLLPRRRELIEALKNGGKVGTATGAVGEAGAVYAHLTPGVGAKVSDLPENAKRTALLQAARRFEG